MKTTILFSVFFVSLLLLPGCANPSVPVETPKGSGRDSEFAAVRVKGQPLSHWVGKAWSGDTSRETVEALTLALDREEHAAVVAAADGLETIGPPAASAAEKLASKLDHIQPWIRCACMEALEAIGSPSVPFLLEALRTGPGGAPVRALVVLGNMGPAAKESAEPLREIAKEKEALRARIEGALAQIESTGEEAVPTTVPSGSPVAAARLKVPPLEGVAGDWPQFHGPGRDALSRETGLLAEWPAEGPRFLWQMDGLGKGYSSVSIVSGRIFTMGDRKDGNEESQYVIAFGLASREELWATRVGGPHSDGPRSTPTVDGDGVYVLSTDGGLYCLEAATGQVRWKKSLPDDFGGRMMSVWKFCESPLVDGDRLICTPGSAAAAVVALDKMTGNLIWKCALPELGENGKEGAAYSSAVVAEVDGVRQYVQLLGRGLIGVEAKTGRFLWGYNRIANGTANITTPVVRGNLVFATTCYGAGSGLVRITRDGDAFRAEEVYYLRPKTFANHHGGVVLVGDYMFSGHGQNRGAPICLELATGKVLWREKPLERGSAAVLYADGNLIFRYDRGKVALIEANPAAFRLKGSFLPPRGKGPAWAHPVLLDGRLYLRHDDQLLCYDLRRRG